MKILLRPARPEDAEACGLICYNAFRFIAESHNFPPDFPNPEVTSAMLAGCFSRSDIYSVVAEEQGKIIGSNVLWMTGDVAGIGPITVDPELQRSSAGRQLMADVMARAKADGFSQVRLVQAAFNNLSLALYTKLGFDACEPLSVMQGEPIRESLPGCSVRRAEAEDTETCHQLCEKIHGHRRQGDVAEAIKQGGAIVVERNGSVTGYATGLAFFAHATAETNEDLKALIGAASEFGGPGFLLPTRNGEVMRWCLERGLKVVQPMTLMSLGPYQEPRGAFLPSVLY